MRLRPRQGLLAGIAALAAGAVVLEIALARACSALLGQHLARPAPTLALFGVGLGGALLASLPGLVRRQALLARMSTLAGLSGAGALAAVLYLANVKIPDVLDKNAVGPLAGLYFTSVLPFLFTGIAVTAALRHVRTLGGRIVFACFSGAALGGPLALGAVRAGALRAGLIVAAIDAFAACLFYLAARSFDAPPAGEPGSLPPPPAVERPRGSLVATFALAAGVLLAGDIGAPWLTVQHPARFMPGDRSEVKEWSAFGMLTVDKVQSGISWMRTDGLAAVPIYDAKTAVPLQTDDLAYALHHEQGPTVILLGGGGREVRIAQKYGQREIHAVDLDPIAVRSMMQGRYKKSSGDVYDNPHVVVAIEEGRGYVRRAGKPFRNIEIALPDSQAAWSVGILAPEPDDLYTVDAFVDLFSHLVPDGTVMATRWDAEIDRLVVLAATALQRLGVSDPSQHLYACGARSTTLLASKTPLAKYEIELLHNFCTRNRLVEVYSPTLPPDNPRRRLAASPETAPEKPADLRAPTADRPFFASTVPADMLWKTVSDVKTASGRAQGLLVVAGLIGVAALLVFLAVGMPLAAWPRWGVDRLQPLLFFAGAGASIALAFTALVPRLVVLLGHPIYAFTTAVPALLASVGGGGLVVGGVQGPDAETQAGRRAEVLAGLSAAVAVGLGPIVDATLGLPFGARFAVVLVLLMPVGMLGGALLTLGTRIVGTVSKPLVPWCWSLAATGAFVAAAIATPLAMVLGYSAALIVAGVCALLAALCVPRGRYSYRSS